MPIVKISPQSYEEFKAAMQAIGRNPNDKAQIVLEKDDTLVPPFDVRTQAIRKDCLVHAIETARIAGRTNEVLSTAKQYYDYVFEGTLPEIAETAPAKTKKKAEPKTETKGWG
jgi:hypothetical protein